jgi:hypothetical protein
MDGRKEGRRGRRGRKKGIKEGKGIKEVRNEGKEEWNEEQDCMREKK